MVSDPVLLHPHAPASARRTVVLDTVGLLARLGLATVWFLSGFAKAADPVQTRAAVRAFDVLPDGLVPPVAMVLPYLEIALGLLLVLGMVTRWAAVASAVLLVVFIAGVVQAMVRGLSIDCGCFGGGGQVDPGQTAYWAEILRDLGFLALAIYLVVRPSSYLAVDRLAARGRIDDDPGEPGEDADPTADAGIGPVGETGHGTGGDVTGGDGTGGEITRAANGKRR